MWFDALDCSAIQRWIAERSTTLRPRLTFVDPSAAALNARLARILQEPFWR